MAAHNINVTNAEKEIQVKDDCTYDNPDLQGDPTIDNGFNNS